MVELADNGIPWRWHRLDISRANPSAAGPQPPSRCSTRATNHVEFAYRELVAKPRQSIYRRADAERPGYPACSLNRLWSLFGEKGDQNASVGLRVHDDPIECELSASPNQLWFKRSRGRREALSVRGQRRELQPRGQLRVDSRTPFAIGCTRTARRGGTPGEISTRSKIEKCSRQSNSGSASQMVRVGCALPES